MLKRTPSFEQKDSAHDTEQRVKESGEPAVAPEERREPFALKPGVPDVERMKLGTAPDVDLAPDALGHSSGEHQAGKQLQRLMVRCVGSQRANDEQKERHPADVAWVEQPVAEIFAKYHEYGQGRKEHQVLHELHFFGKGRFALGLGWHGLFLVEGEHSEGKRFAARLREQMTAVIDNGLDLKAVHRPTAL